MGTFFYLHSVDLCACHVSNTSIHTHLLTDLDVLNCYLITVYFIFHLFFCLWSTELILHLYSHTVLYVVYNKTY